MHPISTQPNSTFLRKDPQHPSPIPSQHRQPAPHRSNCSDTSMPNLSLCKLVPGSCTQHGCIWHLCSPLGSTVHSELQCTVSVPPGRHSIRYGYLHSVRQQLNLLRLGTPEFHPSHTKETSSNRPPSSEPPKSVPTPQPLVPFCPLADAGFWVLTDGRIAPTS